MDGAIRGGIQQQSLTSSILLLVLALTSGESPEEKEISETLHANQQNLTFEAFQMNFGSNSFVANGLDKDLGNIFMESGSGSPNGKGRRRKGYTNAIQLMDNKTVPGSRNPPPPLTDPRVTSRPRNRTRAKQAHREKLKKELIEDESGIMGSKYSRKSRQNGDTPGKNSTSRKSFLGNGNSTNSSPAPLELHSSNSSDSSAGSNKNKTIAGKNGAVNVTVTPFQEKIDEKPQLESSFHLTTTVTPKPTRASPTAPVPNESGEESDDEDFKNTAPAVMKNPIPVIGALTSSYRKGQKSPQRSVLEENPLVGIFAPL